MNKCDALLKKTVYLVGVVNILLFIIYRLVSLKVCFLTFVSLQRYYSSILHEVNGRLLLIGV